MRVHFIAVSHAKTGPIPVSIVERGSCWPACALYENGCYAEAGALAMYWDRVSRDVAGASWSEFCAKAAALRSGRLWRYAQAGDLPGYGAEIDGALLEELVAANAGKNVIAFQERTIAGYAMMHGMTIDHTFVERGVSGAKPMGQRPEGFKLLGPPAFRFAQR